LTEPKKFIFVNGIFFTVITVEMAMKHGRALQEEEPLMVRLCSPQARRGTSDGHGGPNAATTRMSKSGLHHHPAFSLRRREPQSLVAFPIPTSS